MLRGYITVRTLMWLSVAAIVGVAVLSWLGVVQ